MEEILYKKLTAGVAGKYVEISAPTIPEKQSIDERIVYKITVERISSYTRDSCARSSHSHNLSYQKDFAKRARGILNYKRAEQHKFRKR